MQLDKSIAANPGSAVQSAAAAPALPVVVMGVAGCGKSTLAQRIAEATGRVLVEGDDFHPPANVQKMRAGVALTDADRRGWLELLAAQLTAHPQGAVLSCSALKRAYRDLLRAAAPALRFIHLALTPQQAQARVSSRPGHFYPPSLVASQFATLEDPAGEPGVLRLDAALPPAELAARAVAWLAGAAPIPSLSKEA